MTAPDRYAVEVRRASLPEVLLAEDVALVRGGSVSAARRAIRAGEFGPYVRLGRRLAVRRETLMDALAAREVYPAPVIVDAPPRSPSAAGDRSGGGR